MKEDNNISQSEAAELSEIIRKHEPELLKTLSLNITQHIERCNSELRIKSTDIVKYEPVNTDYFKAVVMCEYFSQLHRGDKKAAETIIHNLRGQAGLLDSPTP